MAEGVSGGSFWLREQLIKRYRALVTNVMTATSQQLTPAAARVNRAYSPAEALLRALATMAWTAENPAFLAAMPRVKATAK